MKYNLGWTLLVTGLLTLALGLAACSSISLGSESSAAKATPEPPSFAANDAAGSPSGQEAEGIAVAGPLAAGSESPATHLGECAPAEDLAGLKPNPPDGASTGASAELTNCEPSGTVNASTAPTNPVPMTPEEINAFNELPSVMSGELVIPTLAATGDEGQGATP